MKISCVFKTNIGLGKFTRNFDEFFTKISNDINNAFFGENLSEVIVCIISTRPEMSDLFTITKPIYYVAHSKKGNVEIKKTLFIDVEIPYADIVKKDENFQLTYSFNKLIHILESNNLYAKGIDYEPFKQSIKKAVTNNLYILP